MFADEHIVLGARADNRTQRKRGLDENERRVYVGLPYSSPSKLYEGRNESLIHEVRKHYDPVMGQYLDTYDGTLPRFTPRSPRRCSIRSIVIQGPNHSRLTKPRPTRLWKICFVTQSKSLRDLCNFSQLSVSSRIFDNIFFSLSPRFSPVKLCRRERIDLPE